LSREQQSAEEDATSTGFSLLGTISESCKKELGEIVERWKNGRKSQTRGSGIAGNRHCEDMAYSLRKWMWKV